MMRNAVRDCAERHNADRRLLPLAVRIPLYVVLAPFFFLIALLFILCAPFIFAMLTWDAGSLREGWDEFIDCTMPRALRRKLRRVS